MNHPLDINWALARIVRQSRRAAGMTQVQLAMAAGLSEQYISKMERGASGISLNALFALSRVLGLGVADLVRRIEEEVRGNPRPPVPKRGKPAREPLEHSHGENALRSRAKRGSSRMPGRDAEQKS